MKVLTEKEAEDFLEKKGFSVVNGKLIKNKAGLSDIKFKFPWVMKISSRKNTHKTKVGGTVLNIQSLKSAERAYDRLIRIPDVEGILIQEMAKGQEIIIGLKETPEFGQVVMLGMGGTEVEKYKDVSFRVVPIESNDALEMIKEVKVSVSNPKEVVKSLLLLSKIAKDCDEIKELDINPLILIKDKALVADARMVVENGI